MSRNRLSRHHLQQFLDPSVGMDPDDPRALPKVKHRQHSKQNKSTHSVQPAPKRKLAQLALSGKGPTLIQGQQGVGDIRLWTPEIEHNAWQQAQHWAKLDFIHPHGLALMPDVHAGNQVCVGSVLPFVDTLVPAAVGVDIGCGMQAVRLNLTAKDLPDHLKDLRLAMEAVVPMGHEVLKPDLVDESRWKSLLSEYQEIVQTHRKIYHRHAGQHLGTLGGGNHFLEVCLDEDQQVWVMLHSGSRGPGAFIGQYFTEKAKKWCESEGLTLQHGIGYLPKNTPLFDDYRRAVGWAQHFAQQNRAVMMKRALAALQKTLKIDVSIKGQAVECHHNYVALEHHFGQPVWVTRKGAIRAGLGEMGIIPGSMGAQSFIVEGRGNPDSYCSCSHGAGRLMSRTEARQSFSRKDLRQQTQGVECRIEKHLVDEAPQAYKPIDQVMKAQKDLVKVIHTLKQVMCMKG